MRCVQPEDPKEWHCEESGEVTVGSNRARMSERRKYEPSLIRASNVGEDWERVSRASLGPGSVNEKVQDKGQL